MCVPDEWFFPFSFFFIEVGSGWGGKSGCSKLGMIDWLSRVHRKRLHAAAAHNKQYPAGDRAMPAAQTSVSFAVCRPEASVVRWYLGEWPCVSDSVIILFIMCVRSWARLFVVGARRRLSVFLALLEPVVVVNYCSCTAVNEMKYTEFGKILKTEQQLRQAGATKRHFFGSGPGRSVSLWRLRTHIHT